jgi:predicted nucleic acid-binding protein
MITERQRFGLDSGVLVYAMGADAGVKLERARHI